MATYNLRKSPFPCKFGKAGESGLCVAIPEAWLKKNGKDQVVKVMQNGSQVIEIKDYKKEAMSYKWQFHNGDKYLLVYFRIKE